MRTLLVSLLLVPVAVFALLASVACGDDDDDNAGSTSEATNPPSGSGGEDARVTVRDNEFDPGEVSIGVNHEVTWEWEGSNPHSIVGAFEGEDVQSPRLTGSGTFVFSFAQAGTFEYQCGVHGASMSGTVRIE